MRLHILGRAPAELIQAVAAGFPDVSLTAGLQPEGRPDAILLWAMHEDLVEGVLKECASVRWLHLRRAGISAAVLRAMRAFPEVVFTNGRGGRGPAVAEYAVTALLALVKGLPELHRRQEGRVWTPSFEMAEAAGQTVVVLGLGDVGLNAARKLKALGMRVIGLRRQAAPLPDVDETYDYHALRKVLPRAAALVIAAPLTPETERIIGAAELALLRPGSYVVNVGRGEVLNTAALVEALRSGHVAGAALDVFEEEPLPALSPLWGLPNVIISPHAASHTPESDARGIQVFLDNLGRYLRGDRLLNIVDPDLGY